MKPSDKERYETVQFTTKRDFKAFCEVIRRSNIGNKEPGVIKIERINGVKGGQRCWHCNDIAHYRIIRNHGTKTDESGIRKKPSRIYSNQYCLDCIRKETMNWLMNQFQEF